MWQDIIVWVVVAVAVGFAVRWMVKQLNGKQGCGCGCNSCAKKGNHTCNCKNSALKLPDIDVDKVDHR
ncbi:MAG: FeoB-associated Cys-rich membrane protein [Bacteroidales bacterium]|nr:FeoB-associated Cys-rich membrane protein [Bacteroidales bacterium]